MTKKHKNGDAELIKFAERFNRLLDAAGVSPKGKGRQIDVAKHLKLSVGGARKLLEAESEPSTTTQRAIFNWLKLKGIAINLTWLVTGEGEMFVDKQEVQRQTIDSALLEETIRQVSLELRHANVDLDATKTARLAALVYDRSTTEAPAGGSPKINQSFLKQMVKLMA